MHDTAWGMQPTHPLHITQGLLWSFPAPAYLLEARRQQQEWTHNLLAVCCCQLQPLSHTRHPQVLVVHSQHLCPSSPGCCVEQQVLVHPLRQAQLPVGACEVCITIHLNMHLPSSDIEVPPPHLAFARCRPPSSPPLCSAVHPCAPPHVFLDPLGWRVGW